jgi:hypothetical protein
MSLSPRGSRILLYGRDEMLLRTRRLLLQRAGFIVDTAISAEEFESRIAEADSPYDLLILGHTIPEPEQNAIIASTVNPNTIVYPLSEPVSPRDILAKVSKLLSRS